MEPITHVVPSMSFRARLTVFFVVIVVLPMTLMGVLGFELIDSAGQSKSDARAAGIASTARSAYQSDSHEASLEARTVARALAYVPVSHLSSRVDAVLASTGLARIVVHVGGTRTISAGSRDAIAPGIAVVRGSGRHAARTFVVSEVTARQYADQLAGANTVLVVRSGGATLGSSDTRAAQLSLPSGVGAASIGAARYRVMTQRLSGFDGTKVEVSVLSALGATSASVRDERMLAGGLIGAFLLLAFCFTQLMAHFTQSQVSQFLPGRAGGWAAATSPSRSRPSATTSSLHWARSSIRCPGNSRPGWTSLSRNVPASALRCAESARHSPQAWIEVRCWSLRSPPRSTRPAPRGAR